MGFVGKRMEEKRCCKLERTRGEKLAQRTCWVTRDAWSSRHCFVEEMACWKENLEKARLVRREVSSSALLWPTEKAIDEGQRKSCSRTRKEVGYRGEGESRMKPG